MSKKPSPIPAANGKGPKQPLPRENGTREAKRQTDEPLAESGSSEGRRLEDPGACCPCISLPGRVQAVLFVGVSVKEPL